MAPHSGTLEAAGEATGGAALSLDYLDCVVHSKSETGRYLVSLRIPFRPVSARSAVPREVKVEPGSRGGGV